MCVASQAKEAKLADMRGELSAGERDSEKQREMVETATRNDLKDRWDGREIRPRQSISTCIG
jgi:hypothetical protein